MKSFAIGNIVFLHYTNSGKHTKAHNELWASCPACSSTELVAKEVDSDELAQFMADEYVYGPYRHTCEQEQWS